jgi:hypothetical protein
MHISVPVYVKYCYQQDDKNIWVIIRVISVLFTYIKRIREEDISFSIFKYNVHLIKNMI